MGVKKPFGYGEEMGQFFVARVGPANFGLGLGLKNFP